MWQWGAVTSLETMTTGNLGHDCQEQFFHTVKSAEKHCCRHLACSSAPQWFGGSPPCFWHRWAGKPWGDAIYVWGNCISLGTFQVVTDVTLHVLFLGALHSSNPIAIDFDGPFPPSAGKNQICPVSVLGTWMPARGISCPLAAGAVPQQLW